MRVSVTGDVPASPGLSELERAVLDTALAAAEGPLRAQAARAEAASRTYSGVGFMTKLRVPADLPAAAVAQLPTVYGEHPALPGGAEFLVELRGGRLNCVEAFCFEGLWPADESGFRLALRDAGK